MVWCWCCGFVMLLSEFWCKVLLCFLFYYEGSLLVSCPALHFLPSLFVISLIKHLGLINSKHTQSSNQCFPLCQIVVSVGANSQACLGHLWTHLDLMTASRPCKPCFCLFALKSAAPKLLCSLSAVASYFQHRNIEI